MYQAINRIAGLLLLAVVSMHAAFAAGPSLATESKPSAPVDTSIDRIEKLTREVKIAELEKQLREAKLATAPIPLQGPGAPTPIPPISLLPNVGGVVATNLPKQPPERPYVQAISTLEAYSTY